jgi:hypothetical protein
MRLWRGIRVQCTSNLIDISRTDSKIRIFVLSLFYFLVTSSWMQWRSGRRPDPRHGREWNDADESAQASCSDGRFLVNDVAGARPDQGDLVPFHGLSCFQQEAAGASPEDPPWLACPSSRSCLRCRVCPLRLVTPAAGECEAISDVTAVTRLKGTTTSRGGREVAIDAGGRLCNRQAARPRIAQRERLWKGEGIPPRGLCWLNSVGVDAVRLACAGLGLRKALSCRNAGGFRPSTRGQDGSRCAAVVLPSSTPGLPEMAKKALHLGGFLWPGNSAEDLEGTENHGIVPAVIRADLAQADPPEPSEQRDPKCLYRPPTP